VAEDKKKKSKPKRELLKYGVVEEPTLFQRLSGGFSSKELRKRKKLSAKQKRDLAKKQPKPDLTAHAALQSLGMALPPADALDAILYAVEGDWKNTLWSSMAFVPFLGEISNVRRGTPPNLRMADIVGFRGGKAVLQGGGEYSGFTPEKGKPYWSARPYAEPASYPRYPEPYQIPRIGDKMGWFGGDRVIYDVETTVDAIRREAMGMRGFDPSDFPYAGVQQALYTDLAGRTVFRKGKDLHTIFERGLPISDVTGIKVYQDVRFPQDPKLYHERYGQFLEPRLGHPLDITEQVFKYARDTEGRTRQWQMGR
jgi:hypothetical protein